MEMGRIRVPVNAVIADTDRESATKYATINHVNASLTVYKSAD